MESYPPTSAWPLALLILALLTARGALYALASEAEGDFYSAIGEGEYEDAYEEIRTYMLYAALLAPTAAASDYASARLRTSWRAALTGSLLSRYYAGRSFAHLARDAAFDSAEQPLLHDAEAAFRKPQGELCERDEKGFYKASLKKLKKGVKRKAAPPSRPAASSRVNPYTADRHRQHEEGEEWSTLWPRLEALGWRHEDGKRVGTDNWYFP